MPSSHRNWLQNYEGCLLAFGVKYSAASSVFKIQSLESIFWYISNKARQIHPIPRFVYFSTTFQLNIFLYFIKIWLEPKLPYHKLGERRYNENLSCVLIQVWVPPSTVFPTKYLVHRQSWEEWRNLKCYTQRTRATWTKLIEGNRLREERAPSRKAYTINKNYR